MESNAQPMRSSGKREPIRSRGWLGPESPKEPRQRTYVAPQPRPLPTSAVLHSRSYVEQPRPKHHLMADRRVRTRRPRPAPSNVVRVIDVDGNVFLASPNDARVPFGEIIQPRRSDPNAGRDVWRAPETGDRHLDYGIDDS